MRVLVTWGSEHGGTAGIAGSVADELQALGFEVVAKPADEAPPPDQGFGAVIIGGALYANRWAAEARRFVHRYEKQLRSVPVWFFSSGPLDDSAERGVIPPTTQVAVLAERVGALGHMTFGGYLSADVKGFPAAAMAKEYAGDWRNPEQIRAWTREVAQALPAATPGRPVDHPAHSARRVIGYGAVAWALHAAMQTALFGVLGDTPALVIHAVATPMVFGAVAWRYFRERGARDPLPTAITWTALAIGLDVALAAARGHGFALFGNFAMTWLPLTLALLCTWAIGGLASTLPWSTPPEKAVRQGPLQGAARS